MVDVTNRVPDTSVKTSIGDKFHNYQTQTQNIILLIHYEI